MAHFKTLPHHFLYLCTLNYMVSMEVLIIILVLIIIGVIIRIAFAADKKMSQESHQVTHVEPQSCLEEIVFSVKGILYRKPGEIFAAQMSDEGDSLILRREPNNPVDPDAVQVFTVMGQMIGYVDKYNASRINHRIDCVDKCVIVNKSNHDIPYIDALVHFSQEQCAQPDFITDPEQLTMLQMMILDVNKLAEAGYKEGRARIVNNRELPIESIKALRDCSFMQSLRLSRDESDPRRRYAIKVYDNKDVLLGWIDFYSAYSIYEYIDEVKMVRISRSGDSWVEFMYPSAVEIKYPSPEVVSSCQVFDATLYPEISAAYKMRTSDPEKALAMLLPIIDKEKDYRAMSICCTCYRALKQPVEELAMIDRILDKIKLLDAEHLELFGLEPTTGEAEKWLRRKAIVEKKIK